MTDLPETPTKLKNSSSPLLTWEINYGILRDVKPNITLDQMKARLAEAKTELDRAKKEVAAWEQLVAVSEARAGIRPPSQNGSEVNKSGMLRDFLRTHWQDGVTYAQIKEHFEEMGVPMGTNFTYNLINKWKESVERKGGRLFWKGDSLNAASTNDKRK